MSFPRVSRIALPLVLAASVLSGAALAQGQPTQAEQTLKYRKSLYQVIAWNVGPMGAMAQDKVPFDAPNSRCAPTASRRSTPMLAEAYSPEYAGRRELEAEARDVGEPRRLRREDEGPRRPQRDARAGREGRRRGEVEGGVLRHGQHLQGLPRQVQGRLSSVERDRRLGRRTDRERQRDGERAR